MSWKEKWLSSNHDIDQIIPNFKQKAAAHLRKTRELRHQIITGKIDTPGRKLPPASSRSFIPGGLRSGGQGDTNQVLALIENARAAIETTSSKEIPQVSPRIRDQFSKGRKSNNPTTLENLMRRQAILGKPKTKRVDDSQSIEIHVRKYEPPAMPRNDEILKTGDRLINEKKKPAKELRTHIQRALRVGKKFQSHQEMESWLHRTQLIWLNLSN